MTQVKLERNRADFTLKLYEIFKRYIADKQSNPELKKYDFLKYYQDIIRYFVTGIDVGARGLLIKHPPGMGKSITAVAIAMEAIKNRQVIILSAKSLHANMRKSIIKYVKMRAETDNLFSLGHFSEAELNAWIDKNFSFITMNAGNMIEQIAKNAEGKIGNEFRAALSKLDGDNLLSKKIENIVALGALDNKMLIVDEAHNVFRAIVNGSKNASELYKMIMSAKNLKLFYLTGSIPVNDPFEFIPCFNTLAEPLVRRGKRATLFPESYREFYRNFVDKDKGVIKNGNKFQNRILGLVSSIDYNTIPGQRAGQDGLPTGKKAEENFPESKDIKVEIVEMNRNQFSMYLAAREKEVQEMSRFRGNSTSSSAMSRPKKEAASSYRQKTRQLSNFAPPREYTGVKFTSIPINRIPTEKITSPKLEKVRANIESSQGIGYVYSQYIGAGGLLALAKNLENNGWALHGSQSWFNILTAAKKEENSKPADEKTLDDAPDVKFTRKVSDKVAIEERIREIAGGAENTCALDPPPKQQTSNVKPGTYVFVSGQSDFCKDNIQIGAVDVDLNDTGIVQAFNARKKAKRILDASDKIISADILRAKSAAAIIAGVDNCDKTKIAKLHAQSGGLLDGMSEDAANSIRKKLNSAEPGLSDISFARAYEAVKESVLSDDRNIIASVNINSPDAEQKLKKIHSRAESNRKFQDRVRKFWNNNRAAQDEIVVMVVTNPILKVIADESGIQDFKYMSPYNFRYFDNMNPRPPKRGGLFEFVGGKTENAPPPAPKTKKFAIISGGVDVEDRARIIELFNRPENAHGEELALLLMSSTGAEGFDLKNVRHSHILEPYWVWSRATQVFGRGARNDSHIDLPPEERNIQPYIYLSVSPAEEVGDIDYHAQISDAVNNGRDYAEKSLGEALTTDLDLYIGSLIGDKLNESASQIVNGASIECYFNGQSGCKVCAPSTDALFTESLEADIDRIDPCREYEEDEVAADEILIKSGDREIKIYYQDDPKSEVGFKIYSFNADIGGYSEIDPENEDYSLIIDEIMKIRA